MTVKPRLSAAPTYVLAVLAVVAPFALLAWEGMLQPPSTWIAAVAYTFLLGGGIVVAGITSMASTPLDSKVGALVGCPAMFLTFGAGLLAVTLVGLVLALWAACLFAAVLWSLVLRVGVQVAGMVDSIRKPALDPTRSK